MPGFLLQLRMIVYNTLKSRKLTIVLLLVLLLLIIAEAQKASISAYVYIGFAALLALNLLFCLIDHIRKIRSITLSKISLIVFHASFLVIITGGIITFVTQSMGYIELAQGQGFVDYKENYTGWRERFATRRGTGIDVFVKKIVLEFWENGQIKEFKNEIIIKDGNNNTEATINVNDSVKYGKLLINMARYYGLAPYFTLTTPHGNTGGYVNIRDETKSNEFTIPMLGYRAFVSYEDINDREITISILDGGQNIPKRTMKKGEVIPLGKSKLELTRIDIWNGLTVVTDSGKGVTYTGFMLFLAGCAVYYGKKFFKR